MVDYDEAVLVKAHLRRTGKRQRVNAGVNTMDFITITILAIIFGIAFWFFYSWAKAGGWIILVGGLAGVCLIYSLIRWRHYIFQSSEPKTSIGWQQIKPAKNTPLWLAHHLYNLRYQRKVQRHEYFINGKIWQYKIEIIDPLIPEPSFTLNNLRVAKRRIQ